MRHRTTLTVLTALILWVPPSIVLSQTTMPAGEAPAATPVVTPGGAPVASGTLKANPPADQPVITTGTALGKEESKGGGGGLFGGGSNTLIFAVLMGGLLLMYIWMGRSRKKQEAARRALLDNLKKGDKITTIGGAVGTVIEVKQDEVTVKVDESNNVRMKFARWAIRQVGAPKGDTEEQQKQGETKA